MIISNLRLEGYRISYDIHYSCNKEAKHIEYIAISLSCSYRILIQKIYYNRNKIDNFNVKNINDMLFLE